MKDILKTTILTTLLTSSCFAYDNYARYSILYTVPNDLNSTAPNGAKGTVSMKSGYALEGSIGHKFTKTLALEAQYTYDKANTKNVNANIKVHSLFINGIYNFDIDSNTMHPYIGIGLGAAIYTDGTTDSTTFTYQGFIGNSFDVEENIEMFLEYKYKDFDDVKLENITYDNTGIHSIGVGLKSKF